jgi:hypothetical protein
LFAEKTGEKSASQIRAFDDKEAATAGFYKSPWGLHPKIQLLMVEQLMTGQQIDYPLPGQVNLTFKKAQKVKKLGPKDQKMSFEPS